MLIGVDGSVYCVDDGDHTVRKFTSDGELRMTIGTRRLTSDTGYDEQTQESIKHGGPPFNRPTSVAVASNGNVTCRTASATPGARVRPGE